MAKSRLGKGLGALLPDEEKQNGKTSPPGGSKTGEIFIPLDKLRANPGQPRTRFDTAELEELAASIRKQGIIQPVIADEGEDGSYIIVAGERRARAARLAGLTEVPAVLRRYTGEKRLEVALIENIHRSDLNPIEEALAYKRIMESGGLSQDETAARVGKNRSTVANALRLLKLPQEMRIALEEGALSAGHARALLSLAGAGMQKKLFAEIAARGLSVRAAEKRAAELSGGGDSAGKGPGKPPPRDSELKALEERLIETLGTKVRINGDLKRGRIEIDYYSMDDFDRLLELLTPSRTGG
ncbi:MAG: ParB/RepB/Spo0J family partition protein, partial [Treponema sp.]|nr:ParB/RepB/Spo0J family partition protein [Treponema sp.]